MTEQTVPPSSSRQPDDVDAYVGREIRRIRKARGISQQRLADQLGVTFQQVQKYEKGGNRVAASTLFRICNVLGCRPEDLLPGVGAVEAPPVPIEFYAEGVDKLAAAYVRLPRRVQRTLILLAESLARSEDASAAVPPVEAGGG